MLFACCCIDVFHRLVGFIFALNKVLKVSLILPDYIMLLSARHLDQLSLWFYHAIIITVRRIQRLSLEILLLIGLVSLFLPS